MVTILTQNLNLVNMSDFESITYGQDEETKEYMIILNNKWILGKYDLMEIPDIMQWIGASIGKANTDENLCLTMPLPRKKEEEETEDAKAD